MRNGALRVPRHRLHQLSEALATEWILTNALGGYSSSTVIGTNARKYHGLLVASLEPPVDLWMALSKLDEKLMVGKDRYELSTNMYQDVGPHPKGFVHQREFLMDPLPTFEYEAGRVLVTKSMMLKSGDNLLLTSYRVQNPTQSEVELQVSPLVAIRPHNTTSRGKHPVEQSADRGHLILRRPDEGPVLGLLSREMELTQSSLWIERVFYPTDHARKEEATEDLFAPGQFTFTVGPGAEAHAYLAACVDRNEEEVSKRLAELDERKELASEVAERLDTLEQAQRITRGRRESWLGWIVLALDSFLVHRRSTGRKSIIAGYHWFHDWGRDSMISLPGLCLVRGRHAEAREILLSFAQYCRRGIIPNNLPKREDEADYRSVDGSLWFVNAVYQYLKYTADIDTVRDGLWETVKSILRHYRDGTDFGIGVDKTGLLAHGPLLTWMDCPPTPREGASVEMQALWYNALRIAHKLALLLRDTDMVDFADSTSTSVSESFMELFWNPSEEYLSDLVNGKEVDASLRPNQILATFLEFGMLEPPQALSIVERVWERLQTPYGLRTLDPDDPKYEGSYVGDERERHLTYHNGTVWPWLLGPFVTSYLKTFGKGERERTLAYELFMKPLFEDEIQRAGMGTVSEIFDGDPPHAARGCISQAWSLAEPFRAYVEDILLIRPPYEHLFLESENRAEAG